MTKAEKLIKKWNSYLMTEEQAREHLHEIMSKKPRLAFLERHSEEAFIDPATGLLEFRCHPNSGGLQPPSFNRESALRLAKWIQEVFEDDGRTESSGL